RVESCAAPHAPAASYPAMRNPMAAAGEHETRVTAKNVDFSNCDRELVQYPGAIQPHGAMLIVAEPDYAILQASANCGAILGRSPEDLVGRKIEEVFGEGAPAFFERLQRMSLDTTPVHVVREFTPIQGYEQAVAMLR